MRLNKGIDGLGRVFNIPAMIAVLAIMVLTCADVVMRLFRHPITGVYDIVGFLGSMIAAFSLAYTSLERGHVAVEFFVEKLPHRVQVLIEGINAFMGTVLFALVTWQSAAYAADLKLSGEVSLTLGIPLHPFVYGMAAGFGMLTVVLLMEGARSIKKAVTQ